jgi:hypothetical protein
VSETLRSGGRVVCAVHDRRGLDGPRERSLTRTVDGYEIVQTDRQDRRVSLRGGNSGLM